MAVYEYEGLDARGKPAKGIVDADGPRQARAKLKKEGIFATELHEARREAPAAEERKRFALPSRSLKTSDLALITRQLATLLDAGLPLVEALGSLVEQMDVERPRRILSQVRERVNEGAAFHEALADHRAIFNEFYRNMVRSGEASGTLPLVLGRLADFLESSLDFRRKVQAAMIYPILMAILGTGILIYLLGSVVPKVTQIFIDLGQALPLPTTILLAISDGVQDYWLLGLFALLLFYIGFKSYVRTPGGRYAFHKLMLRLPRVGTFVRLTALSRFAKTLGTLTSGGVTLLGAMEICRPVVGNAVIERALEQAQNEVREGRSLSEALRATGQFPSEVRQMVRVGEESGRLDAMLLKISDSYEGRVGAAVAALTALLEPLMILVMGVAVGFVVMAILLPIFELTKAIG